MNKQILAVVATTLAILPLSVNAAQNNLDNTYTQELSMSKNQIAHNHYGKRGRGDRMEKLLQQLDLSSEQSEQIEAIKEEVRAENETLYREIRTNKEQMRSLFSDDASIEQLRQQHQQMQTLRQRLDDNRFEMMLQIREVLTPQQRDRLTQIMAQRHNRMDER